MFASAAPCALAQDIESRVVRYGDLNLKYEQDAEALIDRIENAANDVCDTNTRDLAVRRAERECAAETEEVAVDDVDHPTVTTSYYATRYGSGYIEGSYDDTNPAPVVSAPK